MRILGEVVDRPYLGGAGDGFSVISCIHGSGSPLPSPVSTPSMACVGPNGTAFGSSHDQFELRRLVLAVAVAGMFVDGHGVRLGFVDRDVSRPVPAGAAGKGRERERCGRRARVGRRGGDDAELHHQAGRSRIRAVEADSGRAAAERLIGSEIQQYDFRPLRDVREIDDDVGALAGCEHAPA